MQPLVNAASTDILIFAGFSGWKRSRGNATGKTKLSVLTVSPGNSTGGGNICLALVDAKSGDLLFGNVVYDYSMNPVPPEYE